SGGPAASEAAQKVWNDRASRMAKDLGLLRTFLGTEEEQSQHQEALIAFTTYRRLAAMGSALTAERRFASERTGAHLDRVLGATYGALEDAQLETRELEAHTWNTVFWALLVSLAAALTAAGFLTAHLTRSLRQLSVATGQLAHGVFTEPLSVASRDEIGGLARAFHPVGGPLRGGGRPQEGILSPI